MHYVRTGSGTPPLVFVHGFACSSDDWGLQIKELKKQFEIVACDLRGHGQTQGRPQECTIENFGGDVAALVSVLHLDKPILIGHSMGCRVVLEAARVDLEKLFTLHPRRGALVDAPAPRKGNDLGTHARLLGAGPA